MYKTKQSKHLTQKWSISLRSSLLLCSTTFSPHLRMPHKSAPIQSCLHYTVMHIFCNVEIYKTACHYTCVAHTSDNRLSAKTAKTAGSCPPGAAPHFLCQNQHRSRLICPKCEMTYALGTSLIATAYAVTLYIQRHRVPHNTN